MKAFVTGGTGLLGSNLVRLLLRQGFEVTALVRDTQKAQQQLQANPALTLIQGDLHNISGFSSHLAGCDMLFHTASYCRETFEAGDHWGHLKAVNVDGTIALLEAAQKAGVTRAVYISSATACVGIIRGGAPSNEATPPEPAYQKNPFLKSKMMAEAAIADFLKAHQDLSVVMILPGSIVGPGDAAPTEMGRFIINVLKGKMPFIFSGGFPIVDVRDLAEATLSAVTLGQSGERYILVGGYYSVGEIMRTLAETSGATIPKLWLPAFAVRLWTFFVNSLGRSKRKPLLPGAMAQVMLSGQWFDSTKAMKTLQASFRPLQETLQDTAQWYRQNGYL